MSRYEGNISGIEPASEEDLSSVLLLLTPATTASGPDRQEAIICLLNGSEGWREASRRLGGAFAEEPGAARLMADKEE